MLEPVEQKPVKPVAAIAQVTSFGNPRSTRDQRFYRIASKWLSSGNYWLYVLGLASGILSLFLTLYVGIGVHHANAFASDGTLFSCQLDSNKGR
jgi:hypothetical protein